MRFLSPLDTRVYVEGEFVLLAPFMVDFEFAGGRYRMAIPRGFITDFASVPKLVQALPGFDVNGNSRKAAVVHDYSYCCNGTLVVRDLQSGEIVTLHLTREQCDVLLFDGLVASKYSPQAASIFYAGVRVGGWYYWRKRSNGFVHNFDFVPESYWSYQQ